MAAYFTEKLSLRGKFNKKMSNIHLLIFGYWDHVQLFERN